MKIFSDEKERRKVDLSFDSKPSMNHHRNHLFFKKYIKNRKVLDIGCWTGQFERLILKEASSIVAIDPGSQAIRYARREIPKVKFIEGTLDTIKLPKGSFDVILLLDVLEHLPNNTEEKAFKKIYSLLKKGGYFMITTPNNHPISIMLDPAFYLTGHRHYSKKNLQRMLKRSDFTVQKIFTYGNLATLLDGLLDICEKHLFHNKIAIRSFIQEKAMEHIDSGIASVCVVARKL